MEGGRTEMFNILKVPFKIYKKSCNYLHYGEKSTGERKSRFFFFLKM